MKAEFHASEVSRLAGFEKPWMLSYLEREQIFVRQKFKDKRHGRARKYTFADIVVLRAINRLLEMGARPSRIKKILSELGRMEEFQGSRPRVEKLASAVGTRLFVTEGQAYVLDSGARIIDLIASNQFAFGFMVDFHKCVAPVASVVRQYEKERKPLWKQNKPVLEHLCKAAGI